MKIYFESDVECTVDGVGLLEPGKPVEVDAQAFQTFHGIRPTEANLPRTVHVVVDLERDAENEEVD